MAATSNSPESTESGPSRQAEPSNWRAVVRDKFTSSFLILITLLIGGFSIVFLSATLAQTRLSSIAIDGVSLSIWKLAYVGQQWQALRRQHEDQVRERSNTEHERDDLAATVATTEGNWRQRWEEIGPLLELLSQRI